MLKIVPPQILSEPELAPSMSHPQDESLPPAKLPRVQDPAVLQSAADPPKAQPPVPDQQASAPKSLEQKPLLVRRQIRVPNPAVKAARTRLKQRITKRALGPFAGGSVRAKSLVSELEKHAKHLATQVPVTAAPVESQPLQSNPSEQEVSVDNRPSSSLFDTLPEHQSNPEEQRTKKQKTQSDEEAREKPNQPTDLPKWDDSFWELLSASDYPEVHPDDGLLVEEDLPPEARRCPKPVRRLIRNCHRNPGHPSNSALVR